MAKVDWYGLITCDAQVVVTQKSEIDSNAASMISQTKSQLTLLVETKNIHSNSNIGYYTWNVTRLGITCLYRSGSAIASAPNVPVDSRDRVYASNLKYGFCI